jgi:hypothetical protein
MVELLYGVFEGDLRICTKWTTCFGQVEAITNDTWIDGVEGLTLILIKRLIAKKV